MNSLKDKVMAVTGAGSGMGREIALLCSKRGATVALADCNLSTVKETAEMIAREGGKASVHQVDVSNRIDVQQFAKEVVEAHGVVDGVFNNAGIMPKFERFETSDYEVMERMLSVNLWGVVYGSKEFLPYLLTRPEAALVNTSSAAGLVGYLGLSPYVVSKFAVRGFTEALRMEYWNTNLTVTVVHPGAILTNITENSPYLSDGEKRAAAAKIQTSKLTTAKEAARQIVNGMQARRTRILVGSDAQMQDRIARLFPRLYTKLFYGTMKALISS